MATEIDLNEFLTEDDEREKQAAAKKQAVKEKDASSVPVKLTLEFEKELHTKLKTFALLEADGASLASLMRAAAVLMERDSRFGNAVIKEAKKQKGRR